MLTNTERQQIVEEVNAGTYGIDEALDDIAAAQKGEEVRKALYAEALVLNREGHAGSTDMIARQQIANLQTSVNGQISTLRSEVGDDIDDLETALNSGLATQNGRIAAQDATIANVVANYNVEYGSTELWASTGETGALAAGTTVTLSEDASHFDYIDIYSFCGNSNVLDTVPVDAKLQSSQGYALRWVNLSDPGSGTYEAYVRIVETKIKIIGTTLTIVHQVTYRNGSSVTISGAEITQSNRSTYVGELGIMKVVGRKITANTEVTDIRTGADGTTYNSAGAAIRAQIGDVADAIPAVDDTLSVSGAAADAAAVGAALINAGGGGADVPSSVRQALYALLSSAAYTGTGLDDDIAIIRSWAQEISTISLNTDTASISGSGTVQLTASTVPSGGVVAWSSSNPAVATVSSAGLVTSVGNGTCYITASSGGKTARCAVTVSGLVTLTGITAVYTQSGTVLETTSLNDLKPDLVVTASYDDSSSATVTNYELSGTLTEGTSTITVTYGGKNATFTVTVSANYAIGYNSVGTPSIADNILSVSRNNFIKSTINFSPSNSPWKITSKFRPTGTQATYTDIFGSVDESNASYRGLLIELTTSGIKAAMYLSSTGSSWNISSGIGAECDIPHTQNDWLWLELSFTGTKYIIKYSTDGETYTTGESITRSDYVIGGYPVGFGLYRNGSLNGDIDLSECKIYINDKLVWKAA